jgi:hypothetical protein
MSVTDHVLYSERDIRPNDEPERGRCKSVAVCRCGVRGYGFANTSNAARRWARAHLWLEHIKAYAAPEPTTTDVEAN